MSSLEDTFAVYMAALAPDLAARMVEQHRIAPGRKFRLDFAFPAGTAGDDHDPVDAAHATQREQSQRGNGQAHA